VEVRSELAEAQSRAAAQQQHSEELAAAAAEQMARLQLEMRVLCAERDGGLWGRPVSHGPQEIDGDASRQERGAGGTGNGEDGTAGSSAAAGQEPAYASPPSRGHTAAGGARPRADGRPTGREEAAKLSLLAKVSRSPHKLRDARPPMTILERFAHVKIEIGLSQTLNMIETVHAAFELLGLNHPHEHGSGRGHSHDPYGLHGPTVVEESLCLPECLEEIETVLGLGPPSVDLSDRSRSPTYRQRQEQQQERRERAARFEARLRELDALGHDDVDDFEPGGSPSNTEDYSDT